MGGSDHLDVQMALVLQQQACIVWHDPLIRHMPSIVICCPCSAFSAPVHRLFTLISHPTRLGKLKWERARTSLLNLIPAWTSTAVRARAIVVQHMLQYKGT